MAGAVFGRIADIEHVERALPGLALPLRQQPAVDRRHAIAPGHRLGPLLCRGDAFGRDLGRAVGGAIDHIEPGEVPGHRAILQRDDPVRHAGVDQCLRADDAAGTPAAIDHDKSFG